MRTYLAVAIIALVTSAAAWAAPEAGRRTHMEVERKADQKVIEGPAEWFTGTVTITGQFQRPGPSRVAGAIVHFQPGARTAGQGWTCLIPSSPSPVCASSSP